MPPPTQPPSLKPFSRLRNLLPSFNKTATFKVKLTIHEITNVPLVDGNFSVSWKFRGGKGGEVGDGASTPPLTPANLRSLTSPEADDSSDDSSSFTSPAKPQILINGATPSPTPSPQASSIRTASTINNNGAGETGSITSGSTSTSSSSKTAEQAGKKGLFGKHKGAGMSTISLASTVGSDHPSSSGIPQRLEVATKKGTAPIRPVHDHTVSWEYSVTQVVRMNLHPSSHSASSSSTNLGLSSRDKASTSTLDLNRDRDREPNRSLPLLGAGPHSDSGLKLKIYRHQHTSPLSPQPDPSQLFGSVTLDLAEYASASAGMGRGGIRRRYLMKEGKTNATIKLTIELEWVGGEKRYRTPELQKGGVVAGIETLGGLGGIGDDVLEHRKLRPTMSRTSSQSTATGSVSTRTGAGSSAQSEFYSSLAPSTGSLSLPPERIQGPSRPRKPADAHLLPPPSPSKSDKRGFSPSPSPKPARHRQHHHHQHGGSGSTLSAERVIEAIFNPYPSNTPGPFTVPYVNKERGRRNDVDLETLMYEEMQGTGHKSHRDDTIKRPVRPSAGDRLRTAFGTKEGERTRDRLSSYRHTKRDGKHLEHPKPADGILAVAMAAAELKTQRQNGVEEWPSDTGRSGWGRKRSEQDAAAGDGAEREKKEQKYSAPPIAGSTDAPNRVPGIQK